MAHYRDAQRVNYIIQNWMRNPNTIEYLALWEQLNNPEFKSIEFDALRNQAGLNSFALTPKLWVEKTAAVGIVSQGGTLRRRQCTSAFAQKIKFSKNK